MTELFFTIIILGLIFFEYKIYKSFFTPFIITASTHVILINLNNFFAIKLGFFQINDISILYILYFLIIIFFVSIIINFLFKRNNITVRENLDKYMKNVLIEKKKLIVILFLVGLISKYVSLFQVIIVYGFGNIKGTAYGIFAHIGNMGLVLTPFIFLFYLRSKNKFLLLMCILMYINLFIFGGKYVVIISLLHVIVLYSIFKDVGFIKTIKVIFLIIVFGVATFIVIYAVIPLFDKEITVYVPFSERLTFALNHFYFYLLSPLIATNYFFSAVKMDSPEILFTVPINMFKAVFQLGEYINPVYNQVIPVHYFYSTNVGGLFSETVYQTNFFAATLYVSLIFTCIYLIYCCSKYKGMFLGVTALMLAICAMFFFGNFLNVSGIFMPLIYLFIVEIILMIKIKVR